MYNDPHAGEEYLNAMEPLTGTDLANIVVFVLSSPPHVEVSYIICDSMTDRFI